MLSCKQVTELCSQAMDRKLGLGESFSMSTHLMMCTGCSNYRRQLLTLREVARAYADGQAVAASPDEKAD